MSITDETSFGNISRAIIKLESFQKGGFKAVEDSVQEMMKKYKISNEQALTDALQMSNQSDREDALRKLVRSGQGWMKNLFDSMTGGDREFFGKTSANEKISNLENKKQLIEDTLLNLNKKTKSVGNVLALSVNNNPDLLNAFSKELIGKKVDKDGNDSAFKDLYSIPETEKTEEQINKEMQDSLDKKIKDIGATWASKYPTSADKDAYVDSFKNDYKNDSKKEYKKKSGFWSSFFGMLFNDFDKKVDKTKLNY